MKIGVLCPSEIAFRRFMPAIQLLDAVEYVGIGVCTKKELFLTKELDDNSLNNILRAEHEKASKFLECYGGCIFDGYQALIESEDVEAVYIPLPPALHFHWAKLALLHGKHVLVEKPATISANDTKELVKIATEKGLALHENYMFCFHNQLQAIEDAVLEGMVGDVRLYRVSFGFPRRASNDFRYNSELGGGALIDAGGYTMKYATMLLGRTARLKYAQLNYLDEFEVDIYGSAALVNDEGITVQVAFGMDHNYKCELEVWGSKGCLTTNRILTAPAEYVPEAVVERGNEKEVLVLPQDNAFKKSVEYFVKCVDDEKLRINTYGEMIIQAEMVDKFRQMA